MKNVAKTQNTTVSLFAIASAILAYQPIHWLFKTWTDTSYQSSGIVYVIGILVLVVWSMSSERISNSTSKSDALKILMCAAALRLFSQLTAINIIGGVALALDVFALLTWFGFQHRARAISPFWVSVLFLFTLPFERVAQRIFGYPLQEISAWGACNLLTPFFNDLVCEGVRLQVAGNDVLVDLPCSGTVSLMLCLATVVALNAIVRPDIFYAAKIFALTMLFSVIGNALRITLLAIGIVYQDTTGLDVMAQPTHDAIGYATLLFSLAPIIWLYRIAPRKTAKVPALLVVEDKDYHPSLPFIGATFVALAILIVSLPRQALDVSPQHQNTQLPLSLNGEVAKAVALTSMESAYFEQFGGSAQKSNYGPMSLTLVQTTSPLRHLHAPDDCLRGLGYNVTFLGTRFRPVPTAIYKAENQNGLSWHVAVTFSAADGTTTSNVAEAIWHWLKNPDVAWQSVQRITPWMMNDALRTNFDIAAISSLKLF